MIPKTDKPPSAHAPKPRIPFWLTATNKYNPVVPALDLLRPLQRQCSGCDLLGRYRSKNTRPCHFEAHSRPRLRQLPGRQHGRLVGVVTASWCTIDNSFIDKSDQGKLPNSCHVELLPAKEPLDPHFRVADYTPKWTGFVDTDFIKASAPSRACVEPGSC